MTPWVHQKSRLKRIFQFNRDMTFSNGLWITECHVTIKLKNLSCAKILEVLRQSISGSDFNLLLAYDRQKQHSISLKVKKLHEDKLNRIIQAKSSSKTKFSKQK